VIDNQGPQLLHFIIRLINPAMSSNPELPESLGEPIEVHSDLEHHGKDHKVARHVSASGGITGE